MKSLYPLALAGAYVLAIAGMLPATSRDRIFDRLSSLTVPQLAAIASTLGFFWAIYTFRAGQERLRRERAIEIVRTFISAFTVEVRAALKIAESLDKDQIKLVDSGSPLHIEAVMSAYLAIAVPALEAKPVNGKVVVDAVSSFKLRTMILNFLNATEIVCSAWVYDVCHSEIIVAEISFLYDEAEGLSILEEYRSLTHANVHYPNIVKFVRFLKSMKEDAKNPVKRFGIVTFR